jgi:small subunit ribosomal protein S9
MADEVQTETATATEVESGAQLWRGTGRRKTSVARVLLRTGEGRIVVNNQPWEKYFPVKTWRAEIKQPLVSAQLEGKFDINVLSEGGGIHGQAGAARLGIARALLAYNSELRPLLRREGFLTRDPRAKERKKYGQKGARKKFQWTKR